MSDKTIRVRLVGYGDDLEKVREHFLRKHPQLILSKMVKIPNRSGRPEKSKFAVHGNYTIGKVRRRRVQ